MKITEKMWQEKLYFTYNNFMIKKSVNIEKIRNNIKKLKSIAKNKFCAVVKANAYGHGIEICKNIVDLVDYFAVATKGEAFQLNEFKLNKPILLLGKVSQKDFATLIENEISLTVDNEEDIYHLECIATTLNKQALVHLKYNTGMNRLGFKSEDEFLKTYNLIKQCKYVKLQGIYTHFLSHDENILKKQNTLFNKIISLIPSEEKKKLIIHASNSTAFLISKDYAYDMVRVGLAMYGYDETNKLDLEPALQIESKIIKTFKIEKGETIGYNASFEAKQDMIVAVISMGYADGLCRSYEKGYVLIKGKKAKIVGHICMDMFMCDITNIVKNDINIENIAIKTFSFSKNNDIDFLNNIFSQNDYKETQTTFLKNNTIYKLYNNANESDINIFDLIPMQKFLSQLTNLLKDNMEKIIEQESLQNDKQELGKKGGSINEEYATILGKNGNKSITAKTLAKLSNTIEYEVLTNFNLCRF